MKTNNNIIAARDILISMATKLPEYLLLNVGNEESRFTTAFLLQLSDDQLSTLRKEAQKHKNQEFFLFFYYVSEEEAGKKPPYQVKNFSSFDFSKVVSVSFNGNTAPFLKYRDCGPVCYVSVTFVVKD